MSDDLFRTLAENIPGTVYLCANDETYSMLYLSERVEKLTGVKAQSFLDGKCSFVELYHADDKEEIFSKVDEALEKKEPFFLSYRLRHTDGTYRNVEERGQGVFDDQGELKFLEGTLFDVTEDHQRQQREEHLSRALAQAQKLESLGLLAGGVAHDFNNILMTVMGGIELAQTSTDEPDVVQETLQDSLDACHRAAEITRQLLNYAGRSEEQEQRVSLASLIQEMLPLLRSSVSSNVALKIQESSPVPSFSANPTLLKQALLNLVFNAADACGAEGGNIGIRWQRATFVDELPVVAVGSLSKGQYAQLQVTDNGSGMSAEVQARIFEPFFTTKSTGSGLGIAALVGLVKSSGGALALESVVGVGTKFSLFFPESDEAKPSSRPQVSGPGLSGAHGLVLDDERGIRALVKLALGRVGCTLSEAASLSAARELLKDEATHFDFAILDVNLPDGLGSDFFVELRKRFPGIPVLFNSAYGIPQDAMRGESRLSFLAKPYRPQALVDVLEKLLGNSSASKN